MSDGQCQLLTYQPPVPKGTSYLSELLSLNCMQSARPSFLPEKRGNSHILKNIEEKPQNTNMLKNYGVCGYSNIIELLCGENLNTLLECKQIIHVQHEIFSTFVLPSCCEDS